MSAEERYGYLGPANTFCHQALLSIPDAPPDPVPYPSVLLALEAVRAGEIAAALVPIENSVEGGVSATLDDLTYGRPLRIVSEVLLPVQFNLYARPGTKLSEVHRVVSHPHAIAQVRQWLTTHLPDVQIVTEGSTAAGAVTVADPESGFDATVCAAVAGEANGLTALATEIADNADAVTRFVLVTRPGPPPERTSADKTTVVVFLNDDDSGSLMRMLEQFASRGVNLSRIESRPSRLVRGAYSFSIDAHGHLADERVAGALKGIKRTSREVVFLGSYPRADKVRPAVDRGHTDGDYRAANEWLDRLADPPFIE
ncbi:prephenate dehydratase [Enemella evansiae]|uniref:prephenate dehydratase n=1 Tax=Enemella evansiae TaxID=2016499 RepID=UPI000B965C0A|nr:prephenate dehydratase [Enemella evansiae]OYN98795.1 prephenate dehydratase [Enemella evansiae]